jgi:hypothetical protein
MTPLLHKQGRQSPFNALNFPTHPFLKVHPLAINVCIAQHALPSGCDLRAVKGAVLVGDNADDVSDWWRW